MADDRQVADNETNPEEMDPDDLELQEAEKEVAQEQGDDQGAETAGAEPSSSGQSSSAEQEQPAEGGGQQAQGEQPAQQPAQQQPYVPKARLDEEIRKRQQLAAENQQLKGAVQAYQQMGYTRAQAENLAHGHDANAGAQQQQQPQETVEGLQEQIAQAYDKVDEGEMSMAEAKREEMRLQQRMQELRQPQEPQGQQQQQQTGDDLYLEAVTDQLERQNQWFNAIPDELIDSVVTPYAVTLAQRNGDQITADNRGTLKLRQYAIYAARDLGFDQRFGGQQAAQQPAQQAQAQGQRQQAAQTQPTQNQRAQKVQQAQQHPPDPGAAGSPAPSDTVTASRVMEMSDEELNQLIESGQAEEIAPSS